MKQLLLIIACLISGFALANETVVRTQAEYQDALKKVQAGDTIILGNGTWNDFEMVFSGQGTAANPITLMAETKGKVVISGRSNLRISGEHLHVTGLVFKNGYSPTNTVISFRRSKGQYANNSRVSEVVVDHFNNPERHETDFWVIMYGKNNRFDHNHLEGKSNNGVTMAVRLDSIESQENHHRIDHNYFGHRPILGSNGGETLRIGTSKYSLTNSFTVVENNYFERCNGEVEIVSIKSGKNVFRGNVFFESRGTLTLRHGNDNLLEGNVFLGNGVDHTGGIRVINKRQTVRNNYMSGLTGYRFGGGLVVMNGVPDSPINRYHQVEDSVIENNSIIDVDHIELAAGSDAERSAVPITTKFLNNLIVNRKKSNSIAVHDDISGISFANNVVDGVSKLPSKKGFKKRSVKLKRAANGLEYPATKSGADAGVATGLPVLPRKDTGPSWYPKPTSNARFDTGKRIEIGPGQDTLSLAISQAAAGDIIELAAGEYTVTKILELDKPITVKGLASQPGSTVIKYDRTTLFELADGGSLKIDNIHIDGVDAPDTYGNSVIRTSRYSMLGNYMLCVSNTLVSNLNVNHSFNFLKVSMHTFATSIQIEDSNFSDVSGHVVALEREVDDLGIYNAEYVTITESGFENIGGAVVNVYRGGTDESTFGPHVVLKGNTLESVGSNKRNKTKASVYLLGVQVATIVDNVFRDSEPVRVVQTVGDPITTITDNKQFSTAAPIVTDFERSAK